MFWGGGCQGVLGEVEGLRGERMRVVLGLMVKAWVSRRVNTPHHQLSTNLLGDKTTYTLTYAHSTNTHKH